MSESNDTKSFAAASSGKSPEEIAFELVNKLKGQGVWGERNKSDILDMYAECLDAAKGLRAYEGQNRIVAPIKTVGQDRQAAPVQAAAPAQIAPQPMQPQPVQVQQAALHQAYNSQT